MIKRVILTVLVLFLLTACFGPAPQEEAGRDVSLEFTKFPDYDIYEFTPFQIGVKITNDVPQDVNGYLCLNDLAPNHYGGIPSTGNCQSVYIPAAQFLSDNELHSEEVEFYFPSTGITYEYSNIPDEFISTETIFAKLNYEVTTISQAQICIIDPFLEQSIQDLPCKASELLSDVQQSDMPIEVLKIEPHILPTQGNMAQIMLKIYVGIVEEGYLIDYKNLAEGKPSKSAGVDTIVSIGGHTVMECKPLENGKLMFGTKDERVITCITTTPILEEAYTDVVLIQFHYGFQKEIHNSLTLNKEVI